MSIFFADSQNFPQSLFFSSENAVSDNSNSTFNSVPIQLTSNLFDSVVLKSGNFPKSWYNMPPNYNTFLLTEVISSVSTNVTVTIPVGNYTKNNLLLLLISVLNSASPNHLTYNVTYSSANVGDTYKMTYSVSGATVTSTITMFTGYTSPYRQLGFETGQAYSFTNTIPLVTPNCINLNYVGAIVITTDMIRDNGGVLCRILNCGVYPYMSTIYYEQINYDINTHILTPETNSFKFSATDEVGQPIDFNGASWLMECIEFTRSNIHEIQNSELYLQNQEAILHHASLQNDLLSNPQLAPLIPETKPVEEKKIDYKIHYPAE